MCILLYVKLIGCNGVAQIYGQLEGGYICHEYKYILLYLKLIGCNGVAWIYCQLKGAIWHGYMCIMLYVKLHGYLCILLYVKLIGCNGVAKIYGQLEGGPSAMGISHILLICETYSGIMV